MLAVWGACASQGSADTIFETMPSPGFRDPSIFQGPDERVLQHRIPLESAGGDAPERPSASSSNLPSPKHVDTTCPPSQRGLSSRAGNQSKVPFACAGPASSATTTAASRLLLHAGGERGGPLTAGVPKLGLAVVRREAPRRGVDCDAGHKEQKEQKSKRKLAGNFALCDLFRNSSCRSTGESSRPAAS